MNKKAWALIIVLAVALVAVIVYSHSISDQVNDSVAGDAAVDMPVVRDESSLPSGKLPAGTPPPGESSMVQAYTWVWQKTTMRDGKIVTPKKKGVFTVSFGKEERLTGTTDCNGFFGSYMIGSDGILSIGQIASTKMYCQDSQEALFVGQVGSVSGYELSSSLELMLRTDQGVMLFGKVPPERI